MITKNRSRELPSFANINLLGKCNVNCYFCLGKDIPELLDRHDQTKLHFSEWKNFETFITECKQNDIRKIYLTGQNTDSLLYRHKRALISELQVRGFGVGLRTNGYLALRCLDVINSCDLSVGYSIHSLVPETNKKIMGTSKIPDWDSIISLTKNPRVSIVLNRHNYDEFDSLLHKVTSYKNVKYVQVRRVSTDTRQALLAPDVSLYEEKFTKVTAGLSLKDRFHGAEVYEINGKDVVFWRTVETSVGSWNYFTDGTISKEYFVVEGYKKNCHKGAQL
jgi:molybdenum cofactor biosynthesis enzyme MoaA